MTEVEQAPESVTYVKVGERKLPVHTSKKCTVCMHPARFAIEEKLMLNYSVPAISKWVSDKVKSMPDGSTEEWTEVTPDHIRNHKRANHIPLDSQMITEMADLRAQELGINFQDGVTQLVDHVLTQRVILARGYERLIKGEIEPDVKDTLAASKLLSDLEARAGGGTSVEQWQEFMQVYFQIVMEVVAPKERDEIFRRISQHPLIKSISNRSEAIDAEVVET